MKTINVKLKLKLFWTKRRSTATASNCNYGDPCGWHDIVIPWQYDRLDIVTTWQTWHHDSVTTSQTFYSIFKDYSHLNNVSYFQTRLLLNENIFMGVGINFNFVSIQNGWQPGINNNRSFCFDSETLQFDVYLNVRIVLWKYNKNQQRISRPIVF